MGSQFPGVFSGCSWVMWWECKGVFCHLVTSALSWKASQEGWRQVAARSLFVILLSPKHLGCSPGTMSFRDSRNGQSRTSLPLSHHQRRRRVEPVFSVQSRKLSEVIINGLPSNESKSLKFCPSCSNKNAHYPVGCDYTRALGKSRSGFGGFCPGLSPVALTRQEWFCLLSGSLL